MYAVTEPSPQLLPVEPFAGSEVDCSFRQVDQIQWVGTAKCKHGQTTSTTYHTGPVVNLNPTQMVFIAYRQHDLVVGCDCPPAPAKLNATVTYNPAPNVQPGEQRIILEQSATIAPPGKNFVYYGRLTCMRTGAYFVDAKLQLATSIASGARGLLQVFVAGTPPMLSGPMIDEAGKATAIVTGIMNVFPNQPLAVAYLNTGTTAQNVQSTTLKVSEVWTP